MQRSNAHSTATAEDRAHGLDSEAGHQFEGVGCVSSIGARFLGGDGVLVDAAAEPVASAYRAGWRGRDGPCWRARFGACEAERAVRPMAVLVLSELAQHAVQVTAVGDQQPVEALPSDAADESLSDRVCLRRPDRRADHTDALGA